MNKKELEFYNNIINNFSKAIDEAYWNDYLCVTIETTISEKFLQFMSDEKLAKVGITTNTKSFQFYTQLKQKIKEQTAQNQWKDCPTITGFDIDFAFNLKHHLNSLFNYYQRRL